MPELSSIEEHYTAVKTLLARQKLVEGLVHRQDMPRHALVESLVHKQNLVELSKLLDKLSVPVVARIIEALPSEERQVAWKLLPDIRKDGILLELPDSARLELLAEPRNQAQSMSLRVFVLEDGRLRQIPIHSREDLAKAIPIWVDLVTPEEQHLLWAREIFDVALPKPDELTDLETSARFYLKDNAEIHLHSAFLLNHENESNNIPVAFILKDGTLFSVRAQELPVFRLQSLRARSQTGYVQDARDVLLDLYAADIEYSANALENIYSMLENVGRQVFSSLMTNDEAARMLKAISKQEDLNGKIRRNMLDTRNALSFLLRTRRISINQQDDAREILRDIDALDGHTSFLFNKINFQMDATVGFLNVNQNKDLKRLTVIGVIFMPLNVLAGIGGMSEFSMMTRDVPWPLAYGVFILAMLGIGALTFFGLRNVENRKLQRARRQPEST